MASDQGPYPEEPGLPKSLHFSAIELTNLTQEWLASHDYRKGGKLDYVSVVREIENLTVDRVRLACAGEDVTADSVVAVTGLAALFDFMRVSCLIERVEDSVLGRLLIMFPGEYAGHVYRFMATRDGFNYMAVPITSTASFIVP